MVTPSRLMILATLRQQPHPVADLAATIGMEPSAVSHQLRLLRPLGMVAGDRPPQYRHCPLRSPGRRRHLARPDHRLLPALPLGLLRDLVRLRRLSAGVSVLFGTT
ncbi:ArsR family transcriptional regulator [Streptomyces sp. SID8354]|nr:ArsR family transcriptional regulator [Streptomyces sp. SID8354]